MKLTKTKLKKTIKEELEIVLQEDEDNVRYLHAKDNPDSLKGMEKDLDEMKRGLVEARSGRTNLWNEVNLLKERNTRLSTIIQLKDERCQ